MVKLFPYITLNGNGQEAVKFYEHALNAKVVSVQTFGELPPDPDYPILVDTKDRIINAQLKVGEIDLMLSDTFPGKHEESYQIGNHISIALTTTDAEKTKQFFEKLKVDGEVTAPLQETFFSPAYGQVIDQFGVNWQLSTDLVE